MTNPVTLSWEDFLDLLAADAPPTVETFARSAMPELPRVTTQVRRLDPKIWGDSPEEEI